MQLNKQADTEKPQYRSVGAMVQAGDYEALVEYIENGPKKKSMERDEKEQYLKLLNDLLYHATSLSHQDSVKIVSLLLSEGADPLYADMGGTNCIHRAAMTSQLDMLKELHAKSANMREEDLGGYGVLEYACANYNDESEEADKKKVYDTISYLIDVVGVDKNHIDLSGKTILFYAATKGLEGLGDFIMTKGVDPTLRDYINHSLACEYVPEENEEMYQKMDKYTTDVENKVKKQKFGR